MVTRGPRPQHDMQHYMHRSYMDAAEEVSEPSDPDTLNRVTVSLTFRTDMPPSLVAEHVLGLANRHMGYAVDSMHWNGWETEGEENDAG